MAELERRGDLVRITAEVDPVLEMTEIADRTLRAGGPALLFENPKGYNIPVLVNLFGTQRRVALGMGRENIAALREVGELLAYLRQPDPPKGMRDAWSKAPVLKQVLNMAPRLIRNPPCQYHAQQGDEVDLYQLPIQTCWPGDVAPLVTWPLVITRGPNRERLNLGIYLVSPRRGSRFSRLAAATPGEALSRRHCPGSRSCHHAGGGHTHPRQCLRICVRGSVARQ